MAPQQNLEEKLPDTFARQGYDDKLQTGRELVTVKRKKVSLVQRGRGLNNVERNVSPGK